MDTILTLHDFGKKLKWAIFGEQPILKTDDLPKK